MEGHKLEGFASLVLNDIEPGNGGFPGNKAFIEVTKNQDE